MLDVWLCWLIDCRSIDVVAARAVGCDRLTSSSARCVDCFGLLHDRFVGCAIAVHVWRLMAGWFAGRLYLSIVDLTVDLRVYLMIVFEWTTYWFLKVCQLISWLVHDFDHAFVCLYAFYECFVDFMDWLIRVLLVYLQRFSFVRLVNVYVGASVG